MPTPQGLAKRIREARSQNGLSQDELGEKLGLTSGAQISHWEKEGRVSRANLSKLAVVLNVSTDWLLTGRAATPAPSDEARPQPPVGEALANHVRSMVIRYRIRRQQGAGAEELRNLRGIISDAVYQIVAGGYDARSLSDLMTDQWLRDEDEGGIADAGDRNGTRP